MVTGMVLLFLKINTRYTHLHHDTMLKDELKSSPFLTISAQLSVPRHRVFMKLRSLKIARNLTCLVKKCIRQKMRVVGAGFCCFLVFVFCMLYWCVQVLCPPIPLGTQNPMIDMRTKAHNLNIYMSIFISGFHVDFMFVYVVWAPPTPDLFWLP